MIELFLGWDLPSAVTYFCMSMDQTRKEKHRKKSSSWYSTILHITMPQCRTQSHHPAACAVTCKEYVLNKAMGNCSIITYTGQIFFCNYLWFFLYAIPNWFFMRQVLFKGRASGMPLNTEKQKYGTFRDHWWWKYYCDLHVETLLQVHTGNIFSPLRRTVTDSPSGMVLGGYTDSGGEAARPDWGLY